MKKALKLRYVAFWDDTAWVAGCTTYNTVQQGSTLKEAVDRLRWAMGVDAGHAELAGRRPFEQRGLPTTPLPEFVHERSTHPTTFRCPDKGRRYSGEVLVTWDSGGDLSGRKTIRSR